MSTLPGMNDVIQMMQKISSSESDKQRLLDERKFIGNLKAVINDAEAVEISQVISLLSYANNNGIFELTEVSQAYKSVFYQDEEFMRITDMAERSLQSLINIYNDACGPRESQRSKDIFRRFEHCHRIGARILAGEIPRKTLVEFTVSRIRNRDFEGGLHVLTTMIGYVKEFPTSNFAVSLLGWLPAASTAVQDLSRGITNG